MAEDSRCQVCGGAYVRATTWQRFCSPACRRENWKKVKATNIVTLAPIVIAGIDSLAEAHGVTRDDMASQILHKILNPDRRPLTPEDTGGF